MEKLKLKNRQLEKENALLKSKMIEMSIFSRRMVEIAAKMDQLLLQRSREIETLKEELKSGVSVEEVKDVLAFIKTNVSALCSKNLPDVKQPKANNPNTDVMDLEHRGNDRPLLGKNQNSRKGTSAQANSTSLHVCSDTNTDNDLMADNELKDFTIELDGFVAELTQVEVEPTKGTKLDFYDLPSCGPYPTGKTCEITIPPHKKRTRTHFKCGLCQKFICKRDQLLICPCCYHDKVQFITDFP